VAATAAGERPNSAKKPSCSARSTLSAPAACSLNMMIQSSCGARAAAMEAPGEIAEIERVLHA
jgi:hypothetical protein